MSILPAVLLAVLAGGTPAPGAGRAASLKLDLRASPRVALVPAAFVFTVELTGGADEDIHCVRLEWAWGDGTRSVSEDAECPPFAPGLTVRRRFTAEHLYRREGRPRVLLRVMKGDRLLKQASVRVVVAPESQPLRGTVKIN